MRQAQAMNFKGLSSSCCGHSPLMQPRPLCYLVSNQVSMQQVSKIVENFPPIISIYSEPTRWSEEKLSATNNY